MGNANTKHSVALRSKTAAEHLKKKLASGEYRSIKLNGRSEDLDVIDAAVEKAGGSRVQALKKICAEYLEK